MKILYVAPRYHTNQVPVMHGWNENGVNVKFLVQYQGTIESHDYVDLQIIKPSWISKMIFGIFSKLYNPVKVENLKLRFFVPSFCDLYKAIKDFMPDVVIIRTYRILGVFVHLVCKFMGIKKVVIYTQYPIYGKRNDNTILSRIEMKLAPSATFSPVLYKGKYRKKEERTNMSKYFVPLVCDKPQIIRSQYCINGKIRILDIGKYREYKNHFFIVDAFSKVMCPEMFDITIIGQLSSKPEQDYYNRLKEYIADKHLENVIHLQGHVNFNEMDDVYANNDILLLASKNETAGMVILEAMSQGLCVISSINCGLTSYLDEYKCGMSFNTKNLNELVEILNDLTETPTIIKELGQKAQEVAKKEFCFEKYKKCLDDLLIKEYGYSIPL
jgi:glycosyltransferase involved in cell wall biosynthesis